MSNVMGIFKGTYIAAVEFNGAVPTLTIDHVKSVELEDEKKGILTKPVVFFKERPRGWVLCKTTALSLSAMFSPETKTWDGKRVTLYAVNVPVGKEMKPAIRVKGSPDLAADLTFDLKLPRKKTVRVRLLKTTPGVIAPEPDPEPPPAEDPSAGETIIDTETGEAF